MQGKNTNKLQEKGKLLFGVLDLADRETETEKQKWGEARNICSITLQNKPTFSI